MFNALHMIRFLEPTKIGSLKTDVHRHEVLPIFRLYQKKYFTDLSHFASVWKKIGDDKTFPQLSFEALRMSHFSTIFKI